ncbi:MAG: hypothetical protein ACUVS3_12650 [Thermodesulfobacteriota bacterium]
MKDLVVLVPDKNTEAAMKALLEHRQHALGIRPITFDIFVHPRRDPGVYHEAEEFLRPLQSQYRYALVLFLTLLLKALRLTPEPPKMRFRKN